jgi:uncharacterized membrane protein
VADRAAEKMAVLAADTVMAAPIEAVHRVVVHKAAAEASAILDWEGTMWVAAQVAAVVGFVVVGMALYSFAASSIYYSSNIHEVPFK